MTVSSLLAHELTQPLVVKLWYFLWSDWSLLVDFLSSEQSLNRQQTLCLSLMLNISSHVFLMWRSLFLRRRYVNVELFVLCERRFGSDLASVYRVPVSEESARVNLQRAAASAQGYLYIHRFHTSLLLIIPLIRPVEGPEGTPLNPVHHLPLLPGNTGVTSA